MSVTKLASPDVLIEATADVGEGPVVDHRTGRLCWVDITAGWIHENDLGSGAQVSVHFDTMMGAAVPRATQGGFAVAFSQGFGFVDDGELWLADGCLPEAHRRMNDAKCDSRGRLWAGSNHLEFEPGLGMLHRWDGDGPSQVMAGGMILPNGLGWSPDDRTMYLVDSFANVLQRADFDADEGRVGSFSPLCTVEPGLPDGLAVDQDGFIWVAVWGGSEVRRFSPTGELSAVVPMPVAQPSSCAFGDDGTLFVTSARSGLSEEDLSLQPHAGSVFALATDTRGVPVAPFRG
ncbi:MAG TPA: SMP-30/gluconolactonase/LRE family protein [Nocardioidaceae bacterium]|nr:SMP-30/gluconolactonase/LRE family protein [Nocardioidaceae bacterium]